MSAELSLIQRLVAALAIIAEKEGKCDYSFEHDVMYVGNPNQYSSEEIALLDSLGFYVDEDLDCFYTFS